MDHANAKLIAPRELAARLGVHRATVERWAAAGKLPAPVRLSRKILRFRPEDIDAWLELRTARTN